MRDRSETVHASAVRLGERALLIRGEAGSGKSSLAAALIAGLPGAPRAALIADDRAILRLAGGRLIVSPHPDIAGLIELRGIGIVHIEPDGAGCVGAVLDLESELPRMPEAIDKTTVLLGVLLPRLSVRAGLGSVESLLPRLPHLCALMTR